MAAAFTHLHLHTEYSLLDGMSRIREILQRVKDLGMNAAAITDHGVMYGVIDFYLTARELGVKPIIGLEVYVAPGNHTSRTPADKSPFHLLLLAKNEVGYRNLIQLTTRAHVDGFYYKPRVDRELLAKHASGLIATTGCPSSEVGRLLRDGRYDDARAAAAWHKEVFPEYYVELQDHQIPEFAGLNDQLVRLARELSLPLLATNDVHYTRREDARLQDILLCIQTNTTTSDPKRLRMPNDSFYLKSPAEMAALFPEWPEAIENTQRVADQCNLELEFNRLHLPEVDLPAGMDADDYLCHLCYERIGRRYPILTDEVKQRLEYELDVIQQTRFAQYFLVVEDFATFARSRNIPLGVRGSAAGSIVLHALGITDVDPLANRLVFERFLNIERKEMPDIDMDFADDRRDEVIEYVAGKYGRDHVAQIITFGTLGAKAAIRDVGRALGMSFADVDRVARLVPMQLHMTIDKALAENPELKSLYEVDSAVQNLIDLARGLEGIARHASTHAAGVVISRDPLTNHVPLQRPFRADKTANGAGEILMTQFEMNTVAKVGLLKMDFLGLINLSIIGRSVELIKRTRGIDLDLEQIPFDDARTYELLAAGETTDVFQLESPPMRRYIKELRPANLGEVAAMIALYRPGPMAHIPRYIDGKFGRVPVTYLHPRLEPILKETFGVIVYQDQVLFILREIGGYSLGKADIVRKAMGKKNAELMKSQREEFLQGAERQGVDREIAEQIFELIEPFAGYAFNRAHSACYALVAYQTAYLKANYSAEYMTAVLSAHGGQAEKVAADVAECRRLGIEVLPPDVNQSEVGFKVERVDAPAIRFGLAAIKNVGAGVVEGLVAVRERGGPFKSIEDFARRVDLRNVNRRVLESLVKAGALDSLGSRGALLRGLDRIVQIGQQHQRLQESGQATMFDLWGASVPVPLPELSLEEAAVPMNERLAWERELLGIYLSEHPFSRAARALANHVTAFCGQIDAEMAGQAVTVAGLVKSARQLFTKDKRPFLSAVLEDLVGNVEVMVWPDVYEQTRELWQSDAIVVVQGKVRVRGDRVAIACESVSPYADTGSESDLPAPEAAAPVAVSEDGPTYQAEPPASAAPTAEPARTAAPSRPPAARPAPRSSRAGKAYALRITLTRGDSPDGDVARLRAVHQALKAAPGNDSVDLVIANGHGTVYLALPNVRTAYSPQLRQELTAILGEGSVFVHDPEGGDLL